MPNHRILHVWGPSLQVRRWQGGSISESKPWIHGSEALSIYTFSASFLSKLAHTLLKVIDRWLKTRLLPGSSLKSPNQSWFGTSPLWVLPTLILMLLSFLIPLHPHPSPVKHSPGVYLEHSFIFSVSRQIPIGCLLSHRIDPVWFSTAI